MTKLSTEHKIRSRSGDITNEIIDIITSQLNSGCRDFLIEHSHKCTYSRTIIAEKLKEFNACFNTSSGYHILHTPPWYNFLLPRPERTYFNIEPLRKSTDAITL